MRVRGWTPNATKAPNRRKGNEATIDLRSNLLGSRTSWASSKMEGSLCPSRAYAFIERDKRETIFLKKE